MTICAGASTTPYAGALPQFLTLGLLKRGGGQGYATAAGIRSGAGVEEYTLSTENKLRLSVVTYAETSANG